MLRFFIRFYQLNSYVTGRWLQFNNLGTLSYIINTHIRHIPVALQETMHIGSSMFGSQMNNVRQNQDHTFRVTRQNAFMLETCVIVCRKRSGLIFQVINIKHSTKMGHRLLRTLFPARQLGWQSTSCTHAKTWLLFPAPKEEVGCGDELLYGAPQPASLPHQ